MSVDEMLKLPYAQRRIIVVTDRPPAAPSGFDWSRLAKTAASALSLVSPFAGIAVDVFLEVREKMRAAGEEITAVPWTETDALRFPVGHPRKKVVYIGHPVEPPVYVPVADFHRFLFEHKVAEAQRLIRCLGALTVEIIRVEGWDRTVGVSAGLDDVASAAANKETSAGRTVLTRMKLNPAKPPHVPDDLVWLPHEPLWQEVVQARLESGLDAFLIDVRATDDYGVNASLKALIAKTGLEIGGSFVEHRNTVWRLQGTFSQPSGTT